MKLKFYYSVLRACKLYTDDHYQTATKNVLPFIRNNELCMCYKILFWPAIFQRFFPSSALGPVLRASHIAQEPTGSFPRPSFLAPWEDRCLSAERRENGARTGLFLVILLYPCQKLLVFRIAGIRAERYSSVACVSYLHSLFSFNSFWDKISERNDKCLQS